MATQAKEAVEAAREREREIEIDYGAWQLLKETLMDAENSQTVHLGSALVNPVSERMKALTQGRYGDVQINPALDTSGISLGGEEREYSSLSFGTQEQLSILLRLSIAEAIESFIVIDDQLTQSDPGRMSTIRDMLMTASSRIQVIVFTCRFDDYKIDGDEKITTVDMTTILKRALVSSSSATPVLKQQPVRKNK